MNNLSTYFLLFAMIILQGFTTPLLGQNYPAIDDAFVNSSSANSNFGSGNTVVTKLSSNSRYAFYKFDLSNKVGQSIATAVLKLNVKSVNAATTRSVYVVSNDNWQENTLTWNNQPSIGAELATVGIKSSDDEKYVTWDISAYVQQQLQADGIISLAINDPNADDSGVDFYTKEQAGAKVPVLSLSS